MNEQQQLHSAAGIIAGFMARFEGPACHEQEEVVLKALEWLRQYHANILAAEAINQNNTHTD